MKASRVLFITTMFLACVIAPSTALSETSEELYERIHALRKVDGEHEQAANEALAFLQTHEPKDMIRQKIHYEYAAALFQQKKFADAKKAFLGLVSDYDGTALDKSSDDFMVDDAQYFAAMLEQNEGEKDVNKAIAAYKALVENYPNSRWCPNALMTLGDLSRQKEEWSDTLDYYYRVADNHPDDKQLAPSALFWANRTLADYIDNGKMKKTDPEYKDVERVDRQIEIRKNIERVKENYPESDKLPGMLQDYVVYLVWRLDDKNKEELRTICYDIMEQYPETEYAEYARQELVDQMILWGSAQEKKLAGDLVDESIVQALGEEDTGRAANFMYAKARLLMAQAKYQEARDVLEDALEEVPGVITYEIKLQIAMTHYHQRQYAAAREIFEGLAQDYEDAKDKKSMALFSIGLMYRSEKDYGEALKRFRAVADEFPELNAGTYAEKEIEYCEKALKLGAEEK